MVMEVIMEILRVLGVLALGAVVGATLTLLVLVVVMVLVEGAVMVVEWTKSQKKKAPNK
jgi:hypothetical protein